MSTDDGDETREHLAHRLLKALAFDERFDRRLAGGRAEAPQGQGSLPTRRQAIDALRRRVITADLMRPHVVAHYTASFTEQELREVIAFFESPVGQKFVGVWSGDGSVFREVMADAMSAHADELRDLLRVSPDIEP